MCPAPTRNSAERTEALDLHRYSRTEQNVVRSDVGVGAAEIVAAIMAVDIGHQANPRQELSFQRCLPSIQYLLVSFETIGVRS